MLVAYPFSRSGLLLSAQSLFQPAGEKKDILKKQNFNVKAR